MKRIKNCDKNYICRVKKVIEIKKEESKKEEGNKKITKIENKLQVERNKIIDRPHIPIKGIKTLRKREKKVKR